VRNGENEITDLSCQAFLGLDKRVNKMVIIFENISGEYFLILSANTQLNLKKKEEIHKQTKKSPEETAVSLQNTGTLNSNLLRNSGELGCNDCWKIFSRDKFISVNHRAQ